MDRTWMKYPHTSEYIDGLREFLAKAENHLDSKGRTRCPCMKCKNTVFKHIDEVNKHIFRIGMQRDYNPWVFHGEAYEVLTDDEDDDIGEPVRYDGLEDLLEDIGASIHAHNVVPNAQQEVFVDGNAENEVDIGSIDEGDASYDKLMRDAHKPLYPGCTTFTMLECLVKLLHAKTITNSSIKSFEMNLHILKKALPRGETLPKSYYEAKTMLRRLGLGYVKIHACVNDCVLFWKEHEHLDHCPTCKAPRYTSREGKSKKVPQKILRHFPLKQRLQRLFMSRITAEDMRWHKEKRVHEENVLRHPADSKVWDRFDKKHKWFADDSRNVRLGLASDGFNPFGDMSNAYSMWPVMLIPYNLPPWKCMKDPFIYMSLLIPGPTSPGNNIDVYLQPLIDELIELWEKGVVTYDAVSKKNFRMHAALLWTINDFPAYANLSGWSTKGKLACPNCNKDTFSMYLRNSHKLCYMNHARFLPRRHVLRRRAMRVFNGVDLDMTRPKKLSGFLVLKQLRHVKHQTFGRTSQPKRKRIKEELNWTKKSIFFQLPYWRTLNLRHNLDVMHVEKNICESVLGTLLKLEGKTKDHVKARLDLAELGIRKELHLVPRGDKFDVPAASYTLSPAERKVFCEWLKMVKFPDGYASNISRCVNTKDGKVSGLKSHDCHVLLQRVLPVALRGFLSSDISLTIIELGIFFRELCCKTLNLKALKKMEKDIAVILCKLEHIFPPSFFDIMVHLAVHLPHEAILGGPVQYRWMYPIERFLCKLKRYVRNKAQPEGSIAEAYVDAECLTFCSMYLQDIETQFNREDRNYGGGQVDEQYETFEVFSQNVRPLGKPKIVPLSKDDLHKIQYYVLNNSEEISPYLDKHLKEVDGSVTMQAQLFPIWFQEHIEELNRNGSSEATKDLYSLATGPDFRVKRYYGCVVNGMRFHTKDHEVYLRTQNSGVVVEGEHQSNLIDFFGVVTDIIELDYLYGNKVYLFKCDWWDVGNKRTGIQTDGLFVSVNVNKRWYENDSFVLAKQVAQVFYLNDTKLGGSWQVVQKIAPRNVYDVLEKERDVGVEHSDVAYQEEELDANDVPVGNVRIGKLSREDVIPDEVDANIVMINKEDHEMRDVFIIEDGEGAEQEVEEEEEEEEEDEDEDEDEDEEGEGGGGEEEQEEEGEDEEDDLDEDDDTLIEYCSEEDGITSSDSDSEID